MQTIGERLEEARKRKGISIREASEATKIRSDYLQKFETNSYELNLPDIYVRGFLRTYAQYLKLNAEKLLTDYSGIGGGESRDSRRQDQRESFGRIDLPDAGKPAPAPSPSPDNNAARNLPQQARSVPTSVVTGAPSADRRQKYKPHVLIGAAVLALVVLVLLLIKILPSDSDERTTAGTTAPRPTASTATVPAEYRMRLIASGNVHVKVSQKTDNQEVVLFEGDLVAGQTRDIEKRGRAVVTYNTGRNLQVESGGRRFRMSFDGEGRNSID